MDPLTTLDEGAAPVAPEYVPPVDDPPGEGPVLEEPDERPDPEPVVVDELEELQPKTLPVERVISDARGRSATYMQKSLTYFGKIELYGVLGRAVEIAMAGENGLRIDDVMDLAQPKNLLDKLMSQMPGADTSPDADEHSGTDLEDAAKMMASFAKVISIAPQMLKEAYCIILAIPDGHRKWAIEWGLPEIDDEMGNDILHTFIDQNWGVMEDFFVRELPKVFKRAAKARARHRSGGDR